MKGANEILVEYTIGAISNEEVVEWAFGVLTTPDPLARDRCLIELAELKFVDFKTMSKRAETLLESLIDMYYADFRIPSFETENYAKNS